MNGLPQVGCRFIVLAGDIFDGELRNFQTGLYFMDGMRRLDEAGIDVFMVLGNHDSANRFADKLSLTGNVHVFPKAKPATHLLDDVRVAIHGRSFPRPDVSEDIAREYHSSSASPNQAAETRRCASSSQGGGATALTLGITRQTLHRHVTPSGELRLDGQKLMARGLTLFF